MMQNFISSHGRKIITLLPIIWLLVFFAVPLLEMLQVSFTTARRRGFPPYDPLWSFGDDGFTHNFNWENYLLLYKYWQDYLGPTLNSLRLAFFSTLICLLFAYPIAWWIARSDEKMRLILLILVMLPFWTSSLLRMYALIGLLNPNGFINAALMALGLIDSPIQMMQTDFSIYMGMVLTYLPLMILPLYASQSALMTVLLKPQLISAPVVGWFPDCCPASLASVFAGCLLVFIPAVGEICDPCTPRRT